MHTVAHRFLRMIHAENERSFETALRGMAYPLTLKHVMPKVQESG
ncbi:hypothetical protein ABIE33_007302 [Ensifer sp. 4252]